MLRYKLLASLIIGFALITASAQKAPHNTNKQVSPNIYEDDEVHIPIPAGWSRASGPQPSLHASYSSGIGLTDISSIPISGTLFLQKDGYTLALGYKTGQASGIIGRRFVEVFTIPWTIPDADGDSWSCGTILTQVPQPASRTLLFNNLVLNTGDAHVRIVCGIPKNLGDPAADPATQQRWYGGFFTTDGGYFFDDDLRRNCGEKAYSLTTMAKTPDQLPFASNKHLAQIINEAIDIVGAIQYKRCAIVIVSPLNTPRFNPDPSR